MLEINIEKFELFDEEKQEFVSGGPCKLQLEHSLISISKWEAKWQKPFLTNKDKTEEEIRDYIVDMTINKNVKSDVYLGLSQDNLDAINEYISSPMTATWFNERNAQPPNREVITSELIYYWMIAMNIPFECQKWHLNRLLTLIKVCTIKNTPPKKMSRRELAKRNNALNRERRAMLHTKG